MTEQQYQNIKHQLNRMERDFTRLQSDVNVVIDKDISCNGDGAVCECPSLYDIKSNVREAIEEYFNEQEENYEDED